MKSLNSVKPTAHTLCSMYGFLTSLTFACLEGGKVVTKRQPELLPSSTLSDMEQI